MLKAFCLPAPVTSSMQAIMAMHACLLSQMLLISVVLGGKLDVLERKIYHMESSIQQDLHLLRQYVNTNADDVHKLAHLVNDSLVEYEGSITKQKCTSLHNTSDPLEMSKPRTLEDKRINTHVILTAFRDQKIQLRTLNDTVSSLNEVLSNELQHQLFDTKATEEQINTAVEIKVNEVITELIVNVAKNISRLKREVQDGMSTTETELQKNIETHVSSLRVKIETKGVDNFKTVTDTALDGMRNIQETVSRNLERQEKQYDRAINTIKMQVDEVQRDQNGQSNGLKSLTSEIKHLKERLQSMERDIEATRCECVSTGNHRSNNPNIRLVNGGHNSGRLEVFYNGQWGTVCDDLFGNTNAGVVCRSLGFASGVAKGRAFYGAGSGKVLFDNVQCTGRELSIFDCKAHRGTRNGCRHDEDVGVQCR